MNVPNNKNSSSSNLYWHESAEAHVTGSAQYANEDAIPKNCLCLYPVQAPHAHAQILSLDTSAALRMPGVVLVLTAADIPGFNNTGPIVHDEPLIPSDLVQFYGQAVAWVVAESELQAQAGASAVKVEYEVLPAILNITAAIKSDSFHLPPVTIHRGDFPSALRLAKHQLKGDILLGGQDHFYLETQASWAHQDSEGLLQVVSSTQHPSETQHIVASVLGLASNRVVCKCLRMGGGFGGKETQANSFAALCALVAVKTRRAARIKLHRSLDMQLTGKRHAFFVQYKIGFNDDGLLQALGAELFADGGWSVDLSPPVLMRAMVHIDNAYFIPHVALNGRIAKTNLVSNTAFRGFGGPQGMLVGEEVMDRIARFLYLPPSLVRERNFYREAQTPERNQTHYGQAVIDNHLPQLWDQLKFSSDYSARRIGIEQFNESHDHKKRGIAITPVKFGISFNKTEYNQAGALVHIYQDGSVQLNHGGTEMGQGLHSKMVVVASRTLGISLSRIQIMCTSTDKVPNTSATAASSGSDLNGQAVKLACEILLERMRPIAANNLQCEPSQIIFSEDKVYSREQSTQYLTFDEVVRKTYNARISLSANGFYRTPELHWDAARGHGRPFYYFSFGAAVSEVEVCGFTGVHQLLRVDILHDVGDSIIENIDRGQIEGGFVQGLGWLTCEELKWNAQGRLLTDAPSTYKIPTNADVPHHFNVDFFKRERAPSTQVIFNSKGVGEPPLMLALSVREALRDAIASFAEVKQVSLAIPATPESILAAINDVRARANSYR